MKVYMGKYNGPILLRWSTKFGMLKYSEEKYKRVLYKSLYYCVDKIEDIAQFVLNNTTNILLNRLPSQFKSIHIDYYDTWNLDSTLAHIIHPSLVKFRDNLHSYPSDDGMKDDVERIVELSQTTLTKEQVAMPVSDTDSVEFAYWKTILDEMIWAFGHAKDGTWMWQEPYYNKDNLDEIDRVQTRINNGIALFAKYYFNLWD